jgi:PBSX family phage terminase large subunit
MKYDLLKAQKEFLEVPHNSTLDVAVYQGGFGSGKTFCGALLGILLCQKYPKIRGLVGAQTFPLVRDTTLAQYFEHLENLEYKEGIDYKYSKSEAKLSFKNGSEVLFRHFDDATKLKSLNLGFVEIEEMSDVPEETFYMLLGRLRQSGIPIYRLFGHTNPEINKGWIYRNFVEQPKSNYRLIIAPTTQNKFLPQSFIDSLKDAYDEEYYKINVLGEFGEYTKGLVVKGFSSENIQETVYNPNETLHISCDFNVDPMSWVIAHKTNDRVYFIDEIVLENTTVVHAVNYFHYKYKGHKGKIVINGDASGDNRSCSSEFTNYVLMKNRLNELGYNLVDIKIRGYNPPIKNRVNAFNSKIRSTSEEIGVIVDKKCKWLLYNIHNLKYKEGTSIIETPSHYQIKNNRNAKFLGHIFDAASYLVEFYWPIMLR